MGSIWFPLQAVREESSCLQVARQRHKGVLFDNWHDEDTRSMGIDRAEWSDLEAVSVPMDRGDALCFTQLTPHRALRNTSDVVRWSMDLCYEATETVTDSGKQYGFVARSDDSRGLWGRWDALPVRFYLFERGVMWLNRSV